MPNGKRGMRTAVRESSSFVLKCRGGFLFEALLALALVLAGAALWLAWNHRSEIGPRIGLTKFGRDLPKAADPAKDSVWLQYRVRELLLTHGVTEEQVLKTYNREHRKGAARWVENILEIRTAPGFKLDAFRNALKVAIQKKNLSVVGESKGKDRVVLELGDANGVFERLIFHLAV